MQANGRAARGDAAWIARASTSLPTPVSPRISTLMSPAAARSASACTRRMLSSTQAIAPITSAPAAPSARPPGRARARRRGRAARRRGVRRRDSWRRRRARARRRSALRERRRQRARGLAGQAGQQQLVLARAVTADDVDRAHRRRRAAASGPASDGACTRATENVPPVASARAHSHSTRPSNSPCDSGRARAAARAGRFGCTISTSAPIAIASPGSTRTRAPGFSLRS